MTGTLNGGQDDGGAAKKRSVVSYEKYLNTKKSATPPAADASAASSAASALPAAAVSAPPTMTMQEITNSTDELELEAGEVVSEPAACADENRDVNLGHSQQQKRQCVELEGLSPAQPQTPLKAHPQPTTAAAAAAVNDRGDAAVELLKPCDLSNISLTIAPSSAAVDVFVATDAAAPVAAADPVSTVDRIDPPAAAAAAAAAVGPAVAAVNALVDAALDASVAAAEPTAKPLVAPSSPEKFLGVRNSFQTRPNERDNGHGPNNDPPRGPEHGGQAPPDWKRRSPPRQMNGHGGRPDGQEFDRRPYEPMSPRRMQGGPMGSPRRNGSPGRGPPPPNGRGRSRSRSRSRSPPRHNNGPGPFRGPQPGQPQGRRSPPPSKYEPLPNNNRPPSPRFGDRPGPGGRRSPSPDRRGGNNFGRGPSGDFRGPPGDFRGPSPGRGPPGDFRGPSPGRGPPGDFRGPPGDFRGPPPTHNEFRGRSPPRHNGPFNGPPPGLGGPRRSRSRSPPRGGPRSRTGSPPRDGRFGPENGQGRSRSPPRGGPNGLGRNRSPPRYNGRDRSPPRGPSGPGRPGSPQRFNNGRFGSPPRGPPGPGRPGSPPRHNGHPGSPHFGRPGPGGPPRSPPRHGPPGGPGRSRSPQRDGFRRPPPLHHMDNRGPSPPRYMDYRGPPPPGYMDNRGPPPPMMMNGHMPPPRNRSRSQGRDVDVRKRDRSWEREAPPQMQHPGMRQAAVVYPMGDWAVELKRSGKPKCRCRGAATGLPASMQLPLTLDVVQLPHLDKYPEFLMMSKRDLRRTVYELVPESDVDRRGYDEFREYLVRGRNVPRAGLASEMDAYGYKAFILPPGTAARALGYKGEQLIAVIRRKA